MMTHTQPRSFIRTVKAEDVSPGHRFLTRTGAPSAEVSRTEVQPDDFGTPALVLATLADGSVVRIAYGSGIRVRTTDPAPAPSTTAIGLMPAEEGSPEAVVAGIAGDYPNNTAVLEHAARLSRGINFRAGATLQEIRDLAQLLLVDLADKDNARAACGLLTGLPFDGNFGRWKWIDSALSMAAYIANDDGDTAQAEAFGAALRSADDAETDPLRAKVAAEVRQRQLNDPNLYDREILRAAAAADKADERDWRRLRLGTLLHLRAHGGSETLADAELDRRIGNELHAIRALNGQLQAPEAEANPRATRA